MTRILLLEDDRTLHEVLVDVLTTEGFVVHSCTSVQDLRGEVVSGRGDVALADYWGTSHTTLLSPEREEIAALSSRLPLILLTGRTWAQRTQPEELGLAALLPKPFDLDQLLAAVHRVVDSRSASVNP